MTTKIINYTNLTYQEIGCIIDKINKKIETNYQKNSEATTTFTDGKPETKVEKQGTTTSNYTFDENGNEVLNSKVENEGIPAIEKRTEYTYSEDGTTTENISEPGIKR